MPDARPGPTSERSKRCEDCGRPIPSGHRGRGHGMSEVALGWLAVVCETICLLGGTMIGYALAIRRATEGGNGR